MDVVLVTGCRTGIGLETALAFGRRGDRVFAAVRDPSRCDALRTAAADAAMALDVVALDVTDGEAVREVIDTVRAREGRIDVLVNNAGIGGPVSAVEEIDESVARAVWETNYWAPFRLCRAVLPHIRERNRGVIVNLSTYGTRFPGPAGLATYAASKHAVTMLTESLSSELAGTGVRVVVVEPGFFATDIYSADKRPHIDDASFYAPLVHRIDEAIAAGISGGADPAIVAECIVAAVHDADTPTRVLVGADAVAAYDAFRRAQLAAWQADLVDLDEGATTRPPR